MVSIVDVAKSANVSVTTASRVLSGSAYPVSDEKRSRVLFAAALMNYSPSSLAKAMVTGETKIIGVIIGDSTDPYFATIVRGIEDTARNYGHLVVICNSDRDPQVELSYVKTLIDYRVDGIIFAGGGLEDEDYIASLNDALERFQERGAVCISLAKHHIAACTIMVDNQQIIQDAMKYLIGLGHRRIAYISGPEFLTTTRVRLTGYHATVKKHHLDDEPELVLSGDYSFQSGQRAAEAMIKMEDRPTAVLASSDLMGIGCLTTLREQGYQIPADISVMGIDDIAFARFVDPPLTTMAIPMYDLGKTGFEMLLNLRHGEASPDDQVILPYRLIERKSTAAAGVATQTAR